ncbi:hypothetical protein AGMMS49992_13160 [Clostridia bacterium]|nr:hypothetical protein AGMMS49992_13160 [Clostridia bacterium]
MAIYLLDNWHRVEGKTGCCVETGETLVALTRIGCVSARGAFISFQIVIAPATGTASRVAIDASELRQVDGGGTIDSSQTELFVEWFHRVDGMLIPDMLIPYDLTQMRIPQDDAALPDQRVGALWVDWFIPKDSHPGSYSGEIRVTADDETQTLTITLDVADIILPEGGQITADCNNYADNISAHFPSLQSNPNRYRDGSYTKVETAFHRMAREHRAVFHNLPYRHSTATPICYTPELIGEGKERSVASWDLFDRHMGPLLDGSAFKGSRVSERPLDYLYMPFNLNWPASYEKWGTKGYTTEYRRILAEFVRHFEEQGWTRTVCEILLNNKKDYRFFPYTIDEIWYEHDQDVVDTYYDIIKGMYEHSKARFVFRMDSSNHFGHHFDHRFSDMCGMWVAGFAMFNWFPESVAVMKNKGNTLWVYGGVLRDMRENLFHIASWPLICLMTGADGFCIWNTTGFGKNPLVCPADNGGQALFYPGEEFGVMGPLPSIRLKALRNAMQTADLAIQTKGTPLQSRIEKSVNDRLGFSSMKDWWREKPPFVKDDIPPRYWDFDSLDPYVLPPLHVGRSPELMQDIQSDVLGLLAGKNYSESSGGFRYY